MSQIGHNIKYLRKKNNLTQQEFADKIGLKRSLIGSYEEKRAEPKSDNLIKISNFFGINTDELVTERLSDTWFVAKNKLEEKRAEQFANNLRVLSITVDNYERENIELVPIKASAGYLNGYSDPAFISELPRFQLPMLKGGTFRAFELSGDSMLPLLPGTIVLAEYCENFDSMKSGETYIVISRNEGIVYKRVYNQIKEKKQIILKSDNTSYDPYTVNVEDVMEVWKAKGYISLQLPELPGENKDLRSINNLVNDLQNQLNQIKNKIN